MVETVLYIRNRGRTSGPFDREKLQAMAQRGQLSRMHELSPDGICWVSAGKYPEIFAVETAPPPPGLPTAPPASGPAPGPAWAPTPMPGPASPPAAAPVLWHYMGADSQDRQVDQSVLEQMIAGGSANGQTMVWTEGLPNWMPLRQAPAFAAAFAQPAAPASASLDAAGAEAAKADLAPFLCQAALSSRGWVVLVAIAGFVWAGLLTIGGIVGLYQGVAANAPPVVLQGVFQLVTAIVWAIGPFLLLGYANRLASLQRSPKPIVLTRALDALRAFWIYQAVLVLLGLVAILVLVMLVLAGTVALMSH